MMRLYNNADMSTLLLIKKRMHRRESRIPNAKNASRWHARERRGVLLEKKHFWNIGRCRFEVQNAGNPAKSGTLEALSASFFNIY